MNEQSDSDFHKFTSESAIAFDSLLAKAKAKDEFAYVFAILGIDTGIEDSGWQPIGETLQLVQDFTALANAPLHNQTKIRLILMAYCQVLETNYLYHVIYNLLLCAEGKQPPNVFNFRTHYKNGVPPPVWTKVEEIRKLSEQVGMPEIGKILTTIFSSKIRNAVSHADYILFENELRLKHKTQEFEKIPFREVTLLCEKTFHFFDLFFQRIDAHKRSYVEGHVISGRKRLGGGNLASITLMVNAKHGVYGFSTTDPLPLW